MGDAVTSATTADDEKGGRAREKPTPPLKRAQRAQKAGDNAEAKRLYREALASDPNSIVAWKGLARSAAGCGDLAEAIEAGIVALELDPSEEKLHQILPDLFLQAAVQPAVRERYDALALRNAPPDCYLKIAVMHLEAGDRARGRAWLERHFETGLEPGPDIAGDLRALAADPDPDRVMLRAVAPPRNRKFTVSPAFYARFADADRAGLVTASPRPPADPETRWVFPAYFGSTGPLNPKSRKERTGFILDRMPEVLKGLRRGQAVLLLDHGHEALFVHEEDFRERNALLGFAAYLKSHDIPASRVLILDGNPRAAKLAARAFQAKGLEGPRVIADRYLWLETAGIFRRAAEADGGAEARIARAESGLDAPREKAFLSFNHAPRAHRAAMLTFMLERGLLDRGLVSYRGPDYVIERVGRDMDEAEWVEFTAAQVAPLLDLERPDETIAELRRRAPMTVDVDYGPEASPKTMAARANEAWPYEASSFSIVTETAFSNGYSSHVTEKVIKPIGNLHPFLYMGEPGVLAELRAWGFKTFSPMIDERYDTIANPRARMAALLGEIERLSTMTPQELDAFRRACWPAVRRNYQHLLAMAPMQAERLARRIASAVDEALDPSWKGALRRRCRRLVDLVGR